MGAGDGSRGMSVSSHARRQGDGVKPASKSATMPSATHPADVRRNRILAALPAADQKRLFGSFVLVPLQIKTVLFEPGAPIDAVYFPLDGVISLVTALQDGNIVEVATIGNEGIVGVPNVTGGSLAVRGICQVAGHSLRMKAAEFLNRIYTNAFDNLKVGFCRYGLMCKTDGMVFDDGVVMHIEPDRWLATTTTGGAAAVLDWMEEWLQTEWPDLKVRLTSVTDHWADVAVVGNLFDIVPPLIEEIKKAKAGV